MRVLIDGHNALAALRIKGTSHEEQRLALLRIVSVRAPRAVVYFDARDAPKDIVSPSSQQGVRVVYCRHREADDAILEEVRDSDDAILVVTNDRELAGIAAQHGAKRMAVRDFFKAPVDVFQYPEDPPPTLKGRWRFEPKDFGLPDIIDLDNPPDFDDD